MTLKLWLDDIRNPPDESWMVFREVDSILKHLFRHAHIVSLDHDLGDNKPTGYDLLTWFEKQVALEGIFKVPEIRIHSANPVGRQNMQKAIQSILKLAHKNETA